MEILLLSTNTSKIHLHMEQLLQNTFWMLSADPRHPKRQANLHIEGLGQNYKKKRNWDGTCTSKRELWKRKSFKSLEGRDRGSFETSEGSADKCVKAKWREFTTEISADQNLPFWDPCFHAHCVKWGLGNEAQASDTREGTGVDCPEDTEGASMQREENSQTYLRDQHHPDTKIRQRYQKKKLQAHITNEHRCKNSQWNSSKQTPTTH